MLLESEGGLVEQSEFRQSSHNLIPDEMQPYSALPPMNMPMRRGSLGGSTDPSLHAHSLLPEHSPNNFSGQYSPSINAMNPYASSEASSMRPPSVPSEANKSLLPPIPQGEVPPSPNSLGKRKAIDMQVDEGGITPTAGEAADYMNYQRRRSSAMSDNGMRQLNLHNNRRDSSSTTNSSDFRRSSNSSAYSSQMSGPEYGAYPPYALAGPGEMPQSHFSPYSSMSPMHQSQMSRAPRAASMPDSMMSSIPQLAGYDFPASGFDPASIGAERRMSAQQPLQRHPYMPGPVSYFGSQPPLSQSQLPPLPLPPSASQQPPPPNLPSVMASSSTSYPPPQAQAEEEESEEDIGRRVFGSGTDPDYEPEREEGAESGKKTTRGSSIGTMTSRQSTSKTKKDAPYSRSPELRVSHKIAERKRRKEMKDLFDELRACLPEDTGVKPSKWETLAAAVEHIRNLEENMRKDRERIAELESILQQGQQTQHNPFNQGGPSLPPLSHPPPPRPF